MGGGHPISVSGASKAFPLKDFLPSGKAKKASIEMRLLFPHFPRVFVNTCTRGRNAIPRTETNVHVPTWPSIAIVGCEKAVFLVFYAM